MATIKLKAHTVSIGEMSRAAENTLFNVTIGFAPAVGGAVLNEADFRKKLNASLSKIEVSVEQAGKMEVDEKEYQEFTQWKKGK